MYADLNSKTLSNICQFKQYNLSCIGCCGHNFAPREKLLETIRKNTLEFKSLKDRSRETLVQFRDRKLAVTADGICANCVKLGENDFGCPLHPTLNEGTDLRENHCNANYLCKTAWLYENLWNEKQKRMFVKFLENKINKKEILDWYDYSIMMTENKLLEEFQDG